MKDKQWKDYWDLDLGCSYIPVEKLNSQVNMADLEEGGMFGDVEIQALSFTYANFPGGSIKSKRKSRKAITEDSWNPDTVRRVHCDSS